MSTWTPAAKAALERSLQQHRGRFAADGAEADEVVADLRDHVEREAAALALTVVTEADVRCILARVDPLLLETPAAPTEPDHAIRQADPATERVPGSESSERHRSLRSMAWLVVRVVLGCCCRWER